ncbi:S1/P1 nuclease [Formosa agariphila KMM 3901]|uniref:S1/P1 nuclease n=1 Tax=Formosa agariphila (strain DSM 15362 / KCTC 12365 / LMG 23005 / KMM 3901 / M-2Alg 35-1) TaxID=1347342 RepID=T2KN03_FORAG|nr:S1/P1 nuclease [Formosa agariphila]CDF80140.1 S1/P1 nuclease [Formosa agariphila KMM 3901]
MKLKYILTLCIGLFIFQFSQATEKPAPEWGPTGHRVVGKIADNYLKRSTKRAIEKLLNRQSLAFVSTYGDEIKSDDRYKKFGTWHYVNMDANQSYEDSKKNPKGDAVTGAEYCVSVLKDKNATDEDKAFYLKLLIHIIGDIHQPMHVGLAEDKGGNDIKVKWMGKSTNLHRVWDSDMINGYDMSYTELANNADALSKEQIKVIEAGTIIDWVNDTHVLANAVYKDVNKDDNLGYKYAYNNLNIARSQIQKGGIRLAKLLNDIF